MDQGYSIFLRHWLSTKFATWILAGDYLVKGCEYFLGHTYTTVLIKKNLSEKD